MQTVKPQDLAKTLEKYLNEYKEDIYEDVEELTKELTPQAKAEVQAKSPKDTGKYSRSWTVSTTKGQNFYSAKIKNKLYQLTHLLEFGHVTRDGTSRTIPQPHIREVENKYKQILAKRLEQRIRRG